VAETPGTNFWHSHTMFQRGDGHFGAYVVRQTSANDAQTSLYDYDLTEHVIIAQEWFHSVKKIKLFLMMLLYSAKWKYFSLSYVS
jgi:FtsP/CotA-like multicopper oxidase with cupredoxin domain